MIRYFKLIFFLLLTGAGYAQTADFTFESSKGNFCAPANIQFTQQCSGTPIGFIWQFGNGQGSEDNPSNTYTSAGTYNVTLTAVYENTTATVTKTITINAPINASIQVDRSFICKPGDINFTAVTSSPAASYAWDFGDGTTSATPLTGIQHAFSNFGMYNVSMTATSAGGCMATAKTTVKVEAPVITASVAPTGGCIPATAKFKASVKVPVNSAVTQYTWNYGDASADATTTSGAVNKVYGTTGTFVPVLTVTTTEGCTASYTFPEIAFGKPPANMSASASKTSFCASEVPNFMAKADSADNYKWSFGDGTSLNSPDSIIDHSFVALGSLIVKVTPYFNGCAGTPVSLPVKVNGVIAGFKYANSCSDRKTYSFKNASLGNVSSTAWAFGDETPNQNTLNVNHTYPPAGQFKTTLIVNDNISGCSDTLSKNVYTANPTLVNDQARICKNDSAGFSVLDSYTNPATTYKWFVAGQQVAASRQASVTVKGDSLGDFKNSVVINYGSESCPDTIQLDHNVVVTGPNLNFSSPASICLKTPFTVSNQTKPYEPQDTITFWRWKNSAGAVTDNSEQPKPYVNNRSGRYAITLFAQDINGCSDSLVKTYTVNRLPFLHIMNNVDAVCLGNTDQLVAWHSDTLKWLTPGVSCVSCDTTIIQPQTSMKVYATATSRFNCVVTDSMSIKLYSPFTATTQQNKYTICERGSVQLSVDAGNYKIAWTPAAGLSNPAIFKPVASPSGSTKYTATLTDSVGCFSSSVDIDVTVNPLPTVDAGPDRSYPYATNFTLAPVYSNNVVKYNWSPGTYLNCVTCATPRGISNETQVYSVSVVSDKGCKAADSLLVSVECNTDNLLMPGAFTPNNDKLNDYYYPITRGVKKVLRFAVYNRLGQLVFESKNFPPNKNGYGWNGKFNGLDQSSSTYLYVLDVLCDLGEPLHKQGSFFLLR